ncbi:MAG: hypothetical protein IPK83_16145 [Planctomycetes bacterium]|nr:hypothetical protein [Planctomycetota bacterium]
MSPRKLNKVRRLASMFAIGAIATQAGTCVLGGGEVGSLLQIGAEIFTQQTVNLITDTVFFLLDNFLVRLTAA